MKKIILYFSCLTISFYACENHEKHNRDTDESHTVHEEKVKHDTYFHYSIWHAFVNKVFDADLKVRTLKANGDIGLGSYDFLDGEMVMLDGIPYIIREDGEVSIGAADDEIVYANAAFFDEDGSFPINETVDFEKFRAAINAHLPTLNLFYAFKVHGTFNTLKLGGLNKQEKPFDDGLDVLIPARPIFEGENIEGTMVGFFCPQFIGDINTTGYHFHFIADDLKMGGHVMEFESAEPLEVKYDEMNNYHFYLPDNEDYRNVSLDKQFQYGKN